MKKYLVVILTLLMSKPVYADSQSFENCRSAASMLTIWAAGGASEEFLRGRYNAYYAKRAERVENAYLKLLEGVYSAIGTFAYTTTELTITQRETPRTKPIDVMTDHAVRFACTDQWVDLLWK